MATSQLGALDGLEDSVGRNCYLDDASGIALHATDDLPLGDPLVAAGRRTLR
jgi:hypothetical protein